MTAKRHHIEPWYHQYLLNQQLIDFPWYDERAVLVYQDLSYIYDKLWVARNLTDYEVFNLSTDRPKEYPVFVRPRVNLYGMGVNANLIHNESNLPGSGYIAQPVIKGTHYSIDLIVIDNVVYDYFAFKSTKNKEGSFICFESVQVPKIVKKIEKRLQSIKLKNILINVECIGEFIIEIHLRPSLQFIDISGNLIQNYISHLNGGALKKSTKEKTYSVIFRRTKDCVVVAKKVPNIIDGVRSIQLTWYEHLPLSATANDSSSFRYMVINGTNQRAIYKYARSVMLEFI